MDAKDIGTDLKLIVDLSTALESIYSASTDRSCSPVVAAHLLVAAVLIQGGMTEVVARLEGAVNDTAA